jgi:Domain of unknown function (DUF3597)
MSLFGSMMSKLGFGKKDEEQTPQVAQAIANPAQADTAVIEKPAQVQVQAVSEVDVMAHLEALAASHSEQLNWQSSIVDMMKLLGMDSSLSSRKELATELGCPADKMSDSAQMNMWLHQEVVNKIAQNGGNIPSSMLS